MKIKIEMKNKKYILKSEIEKNNQCNKRKKKSIKNEDQIGQYNISQLGLKDVIEKIENFIKELRKKIKNQENKI